jgi:hypothetical protein
MLSINDSHKAHLFYKILVNFIKNWYNQELFSIFLLKFLKNPMAILKTTFLNIIFI